MAVNNLRAVSPLCRLVLPSMIGAGHGTIHSVSSVAGRRGLGARVGLLRVQVRAYVRGLQLGGALGGERCTSVPQLDRLLGQQVNGGLALGRPRVAVRVSMATPCRHMRAETIAFFEGCSACVASSRRR